jgi:predicted transposase/invertase (TIGR01784 family)
VVERLLAMNLPPVELENYLSRLLTLSHVRRLVVETKNIIERKTNLQVSKRLLESDPFYLEGIAEGKREGIAEGKREGIAEGKREGKREGKLETAKEMLADGYDIETVMKYTKLTKEEILHGAIGDESSPQK